VARLAGFEIRGVEGERVLLRKLRILPVVKGAKSADPLIAVQHRWQIRLVASCAKLGAVVDVLHDCFGVAIGVSEDLRIRNQAGNPVSLFIDHDGRNGHNETTVAQPGLHALDGMAGGAGQAVAIEGAVHGRAGGNRTGQNTNRIMATIAVACEFDALGADKNVDAGAVERGAEGVGVERLAPLVIGLLVAVPAVLGIGKGACRKEVLAFDGCVAG
jgi:hypothetical protein